MLEMIVEDDESGWEAGKEQCYRENREQEPQK